MKASHERCYITPELPASEEVKEALLGGQSALRSILDISVALESGDWNRLSDLSRQISIDEAHLPWIHRRVIESEVHFPGNG